MKNIVASVGLVALGVCGVQATKLADLTADSPKPWSAALTLRGFYDDNFNTAHSSANKVDVFGVEASPSLGLNWAREQTSITASYVYSIKYYDKRPIGNADRYDQSHVFNFALNHAFSPRYQIAVTDSFVIGQEPDLLRATQTLDTFQRIPGDNIRNYGTINLNGQLTPVFGFQVGYDNSFFDYHDQGGFNAQHTDDNGNGFASFSGLLDRIEHGIHVDARWQVEPNTVGLIGYKFRLADYTGDEKIGVDPVTGDDLTSKVRNSRTHYVYAGVDHTFLPNFSASVRAGASFIDYYNDSNSSTDVAPYVLASLRYAYMIESYVDAGFSYDRSATDQFSVSDNGKVLHDSQTGTLWASLNHRIAPRLYASITGQIQNSQYVGGQQDNENDWFYLVGLNVEYRFNRNFSANAGYNFDKLDSQVNGRDFDRNRVYIGVTAAY